MIYFIRFLLTQASGTDAFMHYRVYIVCLLLIMSRWVAAEDNIWDCQQDNSGEWTCLTQPPETNEPVAPEPESELPVTRSQPDTDAPNVVQETQQVKSEPASIVTRRAPVFIQPPQQSTKKPGWTCRSSHENESWDCTLAGADPRGQARVVNDEADQGSWITPTYNYAEEEIFKALQSQLPADPWQNCGRSGFYQYRYAGDESLRQQAPMDVHADYSEVFDKEITSFSGNVEIRRADQHVTADMASYDTVSETMDAQGNVFYQENDLALYSDTVLLKLATDEARLRKALFISPSAPIRGRADAVYRDSSTLSRYHDASFTSCQPGNQDWIIHADRLKMNRISGQGSATDAWLEVGGLPVLYTPYITFPLDDRRISGFLVPTWGSSEKNGFDFEVPYYWNIRPNFDATLTPRYMSRRGFMLRSELRYLTEISRGQLKVEVLPFDILENKARYSGSLQARTNFGGGVTSNLDLNYVSDDDYFNDLNNALGFSDTRHVRSLAELNFHRNWVNFKAKLEHYQTIDRTLATASLPYQKYPQIQLNFNHGFDSLPLELTLNNEYTYFSRESSVSGHRFYSLPSISFPFSNEAAFLTPKFSLHYTEYALDDQLPGQAKSITRVLPIASVDSGLFFEKEINVSGEEYIHTLEPRLFYLYIPQTEQSEIPLFDTSLYDFNINTLVRENRFNGVDRIQDANQVSLILTSRLINNRTGLESLNISLGQIFYLQDREVVLNGTVPETESFSNFVTELRGRLTKNLSFSSAFQWNYEASDIARAQVDFRYRDLPDRLINVGYRFRRENFDTEASIKQSDVSLRWPLYADWFLVGRWQYSFVFGETTESFLGLEKESCCWRFRILGRRFINTISRTEDAEPENGLFLQVELKGLGNFGDKVDDFLEKNLNGYRRPRR